VVFIFRLIVIYLIVYLSIRLIKVLLHKGSMYYRAYKSVQQRQMERERNVRQKEEFNLRDYDVEDAKYEEIKPNSGERRDR
jgi:hypothetical protein